MDCSTNRFSKRLYLLCLYYHSHIYSLLRYYFNLLTILFYNLYYVNLLLALVKYYYIIFILHLVVFIGY